MSTQTLQVPQVHQGDATVFAKKLAAPAVMAGLLGGLVLIVMMTIVMPSVSTLTWTVPD